MPYVFISPWWKVNEEKNLGKKLSLFSSLLISYSARVVVNVWILFCVKFALSKCRIIIWMYLHEDSLFPN